MIYLDNAATSFPKPECVYREMDRCMREYCANPGRGGHALSVKAGLAVVETRDSICKLFHIKNPMRLCFAKNATEALNTAIKSIAVPGSHVITTAMEHNSVMRPLRTLERDIGLSLTILHGNSLGEIEPEDVKKAIRRSTSLIVCTFSSNVNGIIMPIAGIGRIAREAGICFLADAAQGAGTLDVDVEAQSIDLLAFPGHKSLLGPQGTGGLYVREGISVKTLMEGGTGSNSEFPYQPEVMPDFLESGTLNTPGIVGLGQGVQYLAQIGTAQIREYKHRLVKMLSDGLGEIEDVIQYSVADMDRNSGIVAMNLANMDSTEVSYLLDREYGICTRAGLHCSPGAHGLLGTEKRGIVRFSVGCLNSEQDVWTAIRAVEEISSKFK